MEEGGGGDDKLPKNFDVVVIGTGVTESIVSAAVSRNGHSVLHLDPREYYGTFWATLNFKDWTSQEFTTAPQTVSATETEFTSGDKLVWRNKCEQGEQVWYSNDESVKADFDKNNRRFNIDIFPKVVLAREELIELLISSNVSRYLEFLRVGRLFASLPSPNKDTIESIPLSRSDIFTSKSVGLAEKRVLVKFIEAILKPEGEAETGESASAEEAQGQAEDFHKTFDEMASTYKLSNKVKHLIRNAVATLEDGFESTSTSNESSFDSTFVPRCRKYLQSIGRFGNQTPYLWPLYGISEICQAFCRLSAVYGGIFILKRFISHISKSDSGDCLEIKSENDEFLTKNIVLGPEFEYIGKSGTISKKISKTVGRGVIVVTGSSLKVEESKLGGKSDGIFLYKIDRLEVIELNHASQAIPKDYKLLQITFPLDEAQNGKITSRHIIEDILSPYIDFQPTEANPESMAESEVHEDSSTSAGPDISKSKPRAIFGSYFVINFFEGQELSEIEPNVHSCTVNSTDITAHILKAKEIFSRIYPEEEFLPKVPEQDERESEADNAIDEPSEVGESSSGNVQSEMELSSVPVQSD